MIPLRRRLIGTTAFSFGAVAIAFGVAAPPERCPDLTVERTRAAADAATDWIVDNQLEDGRFLYEYDRSTDTVSDDYNEVRHAGVMSSLYQAAARGHDGALAAADRGLVWAEDHLVERDDWIGMTDSSRLSAGTNALLLAALTERRVDTGDDRHDELMRGLARFLVSQVEPSGALLAYYDLRDDAPEADTYSIYYTGEAYWALAYLHRVVPDEGWGAVADRMGHYMATVRDDVEDIWPPLADHWAGYGLADTAAFPDRPVGEPLTDAELDFVRRQGGLFGQRIRSISQRFGPWGVAVRGTFTPRGGGYGVFGEGTTGLWRAAQLDDRLAPERNTIADRATCIAGLAIEAQVTDAEAADHPDPAKARGAWFIDDTTRMDDQQHALSGLLMTIPILESVPEPASSGHPAPMWALWLVVVVGTIQPIRIALGAPTGTDRVRRAAVGVVAGAAGLFALGALSGVLLEAIGVSRPAMRLGAAALCLLSAGVDFAAPRPPPPDDAPSGVARWLVPVAVPLTLRPAMLVAGWSVVADHSLPFYGLALTVTAVAAIAAVALITGDPDREPSLIVWGSRLLSAAAVVASVALIADSVFDL